MSLAQEAYVKIEDFYMEMNEMLHNVAIATKTGEDMKALADNAYLCKKAAEVIKRMQTQLTSISEVAQKKACAAALEDDVMKIEGTWVKATPDYKLMPPVPKRRNDPEAFEKLMTGLGVSRENWDVGEDLPEAVRPHWPGLKELVAKRLAAGEDLPDGLDVTKAYPVFKLHMRANKKSLRDGSKNNG